MAGAAARPKSSRRSIRSLRSSKRNSSDQASFFATDHSDVVNRVFGRICPTIPALKNYIAAGPRDWTERSSSRTDGPAGMKGYARLETAPATSPVRERRSPLGTRAKTRKAR